MDSSHLQPTQGRTGPLGYYWFLTFEHAPELHALAKSCQHTIDTTYFDLTPADGLHLTVDRITHDGACSPERLEAIAAAARLACQDLAPFTLSMERITNLRGAIGFFASQAEPVHALRAALRVAILSVLPGAPVKNSSSVPHVTIAYPMFEGLAAKAAAVVERISRTSGDVDVAVTEVVMVSLERREYSYSWDVVAKATLGTGYPLKR